MKMKSTLNLRDLGGIPLSDGKGYVPAGLYLRSAKLSKLTAEECKQLCREYHISCVIDLRTPIESAEYPDPLPQDVEFLQIPMLKDASFGITHETGSDAMNIIRNLKNRPEQLKAMIPDFNDLYRGIVTDEYSRSQLDKILAKLKQNASEGKCTLYHCTEGKDRTGIVSMALLKSLGVSDDEIIKDYMLTRRNAFLPTLKKCLGIALLTHNWGLVKMAYKLYLPDRSLMEVAINNYHCTDH
jgi:protein-tyrosine phosphatase